MARRGHLYLGRAGQLAVMSEFITRGWNAAVPEVDVGDDILVVRDADGSFSRVQVKSATSTPRSYGHSARFRVPLRQLRQPQTPELTYVFAARLNERWEEFVVVGRSELHDLHDLHGLGTEAGGSVLLTLRFELKRLTCSGVDFSAYRGDFSTWPVVSH